jgi:aminomethyltransferase
MAIQGPRAAEVFHAMTAGQCSLPPRNGAVSVSLQGEKCLVCRTGYTGEDGFEFFCPASSAVTWWQLALAAGATPCGLGARDTLRLEMGYPLNGNDLSPDRTPLEAGLGFFVDMEKGPFTGRDALVLQKTAGLPSRLAAIRMAPGAPPPRPHYAVIHAGQTIGELCSGGVSPSLGTGIAMAYLPPESAAVGSPLEIEIRGNRWPAEIVRKPFYRKPSPA